MFKKKTLKNKILFFLLIIHTLTHIFFYTNNFYIYFFNPLFWLSLLIIFYQDLKLPKKKEINITVMISMIFFILYIASGFIFGFNKNSNNESLITMLINLWKVILPIYGIEIIRYDLIRSNKNHLGMIALITIIIIINTIDLKTLFLSHNIIFLHYLISEIIPMIAQNILFTYLSLNSYYNIPIIIRLFNELPKIILPIIPYSNWFIEGSFTIIKVLIIYYIFKYSIFHQKKIYNFTKILYPFTITASLLLVLFMLGLFQYQPIAILSNSMNPTFSRGDIVIYKKEENILPGDIIVFKHEDKLIVHRVISINEYYVTKGDANNTIDYIKVKKEDIKGVYQFSIKYLGYPSIWLNEFFTKEN